MADYFLSIRAEADLREIYRYSFITFGESAAVSYLAALEECFKNLAGQPGLGRKIDKVRKDYFKYEHQSHSIFYKLYKQGILIMRVLHNSMDSPRHL